MLPNDKKQSPSPEEIRKAGLEKLELAQKGIAKVDKIFITTDHSIVLNKIIGYADHPFLPQNVQEVLKQILYDIDINLKKHLRGVLKTFIVKFCLTRSETGQHLILPDGVFNEFNHVRIHHNNELIRLKQSIRHYLKIDKMP